MKVAFAFALAAPALAGAVALSTKYEADHALRVEVESTIKMETTTMSVERDGEPVDVPGGGMSSETTHKEVHVDRVVEAEKGKPTKIRRSFEKVGGTSSMSMGDNSRDSELASPLETVTLEIVRDAKGAVEVTVAEGKKPDDEKVLEGHRPDLFLDALLPSEEVEVDGKWDLDKDAVRRALRLDVEGALFAPPPRPEAGGDQGGGGGGGRRGGMRGGGMDSGLFQRAEWKGTAKLVSADKEIDGQHCAVVEIEIEASGDLPEPQMGAGGGRRRRDNSPEFSTDLFDAAAPALSNTYEIKLAGKLCFATKERRPVSLELEGTVKTESERETKRDETTIKMHTVREGKASFKVAVSEEVAKTAK